MPEKQPVTACRVWTLPLASDLSCSSEIWYYIYYQSAKTVKLWGGAPWLNLVAIATCITRSKMDEATRKTRGLFELMWVIVNTVRKLPISDQGDWLFRNGASPAFRPHSTSVMNEENTQGNIVPHYKPYTEGPRNDHDQYFPPLRTMVYPPRVPPSNTRLSCGAQHGLMGYTSLVSRTLEEHKEWIGEIMIQNPFSPSHHL